MRRRASVAPRSCGIEITIDFAIQILAKSANVPWVTHAYFVPALARNASLRSPV
jgi:hypothetical protein